MMFSHLLPNIHPTIFLNAFWESTSRQKVSAHPGHTRQFLLSGPDRHLRSAGLLPRRVKENDGADIWHAVTESHQVTLGGVVTQVLDKLIKLQRKTNITL